MKCLSLIVWFLCAESLQCQFCPLQILNPVHLWILQKVTVVWSAPDHTTEPEKVMAAPAKCN